MATSQRPPPFEIPDLEIETKPRPPASAKIPLSSAATANLRFDGLDDGFELETAQSSLGFGVDLGDAPLPGSSAARSRRDGAAWPTGITPAPSELHLDEASVTRVAAYGSASVPLLLAPMYTLRVFRRRRVLGAAVRERSRSFAAAEARRDATLAELVREVRAVLEAREQFAPALAELREAERAAAESERALSQTSAEVSAKLAELDAQIAALAQELAARQVTRAAHETNVAACEAQLKRAEARIKRVHIELRAIRDVALQRAAASGKPPSTQLPLTTSEVAQVAALEQQARTLAAERAAAIGPHHTAAAALNAVSGEIASLTHSIRAHEQSKSDYVRSVRQELSSKSELLTRDSSRLAEAFAKLGRAVLREHGSIAVSEPVLERLRLHDAELRGAAQELELHVRAQHAYDRHKAKQGLTVAFVASIALLVALVYGLL